LKTAMKLLIILTSGSLITLLGIVSVSMLSSIQPHIPASSGYTAYDFAFHPVRSILTITSPAGVTHLNLDQASASIVLPTTATRLYRLVAWRADGQQIATVAADPHTDQWIIELWDTTNYRLVQQLILEALLVDHLQFSADGAWLVLATRNDCIVWNTHTWQEQHIGMPCSTDVQITRENAIFTPLGQIWTPDTGTALHRLPYSGIFGDAVGHSITYNQRTSILATGYADGTIRLWDADQFQLQRHIQSHTGTIASLSFSHNGQWIAAGGGPGQDHAVDNGEPDVRIWDTQTQQRIAQFAPNKADKIVQVVFSSNDRWIAALVDPKPYDTRVTSGQLVVEYWQLP